MNDRILNSIMIRLLKAFKGLQPEFVEFIDFDQYKDGKPLIHLAVVAKGLDDLRSSTRWRICDDILLQKDPELTSQFTFAFDVFTPFEYKMVKLAKNRLH